jgi:hypothetical protein
MRVSADRRRLSASVGVTIPAIRLFEMLPAHPMLTLSRTGELLKVSKPTAIKALDALQQAHILHETTGKKRGRIYAYRGYLQDLSKETD